MAIEIEIKGQAQITRMQPGDLLLVKVVGMLTDDMQAQIERRLAKLLPKGVQALVADEAFSFSILRQEPEPEQPLMDDIREKRACQMVAAWDKKTRGRGSYTDLSAYIAGRVQHWNNWIARYQIDFAEGQKRREAISGDWDWDT